MTGRVLRGSVTAPYRSSVTELPRPRPVQRDGYRFRVAVLLPDCPLRTLVAERVRRTGAVPIAFDEASLKTDAGPRVAAAVVELPRALTSELARLQGISERLAHVPILVYSTETVVGVADIFGEKSATRRLRFASSASWERGVNEDVAWLVRAIAPCATTWLVTFLVRDLPLVGRGYIAEYLWQVAMGSEDAKRNVATAAAALGTSRSVLDHLLKKKNVTAASQGVGGLAHAPGGHLRRAGAGGAVTPDERRVGPRPPPVEPAALATTSVIPRISHPASRHAV